MSTPLYEIHNLRQSYEKGRPNLDIAELSIDAGCVTGVVGPERRRKIDAAEGPRLPHSRLRRDNFRRAAPRRGANAKSGARLHICSKSRICSSAPYLRTSPTACGCAARRSGSSIRACARASKRSALAPDEFASRPWYRLSGGEVQRVALAARLALRPKALLLDEPTANVDEASAQLVMEAAVRASREYGAAVIVSTHDNRVAIRDSVERRQPLRRPRRGHGRGEHLPRRMAARGRFHDAPLRGRAGALRVARRFGARRCAQSLGY